MDDLSNSPGVDKPLKKREIFGYWAGFWFVAVLVGTVFQVAFGWTAGVTVPLGFAAAFPPFAYLDLRRLRRPVGKALMIQTALFWTCGAVSLGLTHLLGLL